MVIYIIPLSSISEVNKVKIDYKKRFEFQKKINLRQSEEIESLKTQIDALVAICDEKDKVIESVDFLRTELTENVNEIKKKKKEYEQLIDEIKNMKKVMNQEVFNNKWSLIRFLIK